MPAVSYAHLAFNSPQLQANSTLISPMLDPTSTSRNGRSSRNGSSSKKRSVSKLSDTGDSSIAESSDGEHNTKKVKIEPTDSSEGELSKTDELVQLISDYNVSVNELFQLKEYGSLVEWKPSDFSKATKPDLPEIFEFFIETNKHELIWDEPAMAELKSLPLRLQKKKLQELEDALRKKYPFMDEVKERSVERELHLLSPPNASKPKSTVIKSESNGKKVQRRKEPTPESSEEEFDFSDLANLNTHYKLKALKYSIPPPVVTHPSHIPTWRPSEGANGHVSEATGEVIDFDFHPFELTTDKKHALMIPEIENKIQTFLTKKYKAGIIDDGGIEVANTPEEYQSTLDSQLHLLKRLYHKVMIEERFELNGDKIERRKIMLPNVTTKSSDYFRENGCIIPKIQGAVNDQTFQDHLVNQGMAFSKIHASARRQHQARIRRIAQSVEQHFRKKAGEKERLEREREQNLKRISKLAIQAVKKRWSQAHRVYRFIQHEKQEELKQIEGREHLSKMLEHSTQLLEAQLNRSSRENTEPESGDDTMISGDGDSDDEDSESFSSSSESEDEAQPSKSNSNGVLDSELSIEQLKAKYADLPTSPSPAPADESSGGEESDSSLENGDGGLASLYGSEGLQLNNSGASAEYNEEQKKLISSYTSTGDTKMLDSDEYSDSMDDEQSSESSSDETEESEVETPKQSELSSFFGEKGDKDSKGKEGTPDEKVEEINGFKVKDVPVPPLLRGTLRPYQKQGLNWLASLYNNDTNGILADEMGLGKTIQTISLLAYLASEHHIWGPHLIVVPTSVMLNWEMEFKKFAPGFKVMTYYGSPQERARKRKGWNKEDSFHVCITSYQLVVHDHSSFKRKKWRYMILDEAHNIKNFRSTRWKALLNFNTENRLLLTGTPLQNNLMELWSLLYFLMPSSKVEQMMPEGFANFEDFQQWFGKPVDKILEKTATGDVIDDNVTNKLDKETKDTVARLHQVLRPYLLRRLKKDVEKQMPGKYEHIVYCRLSKRQRYLYDDFMSRAKTKETLASGNFLSIINCLMQLRKVCNHPDLFEVRPIVTSFAVPRAVTNVYNSTDDMVRKMLETDNTPKISLPVLNLDVTNIDDTNHFASESARRLNSNSELEKQINTLEAIIAEGKKIVDSTSSDVIHVNRRLKLEEQIDLCENLKQAVYLNTLRCNRKPLIGEAALKTLSKFSQKDNCETFNDMVLTIPQRKDMMADVVNKYAVVTPPVVVLDMKDQMIPVNTQYFVREDVQAEKIQNPYHQAQVKLSIAFPDKQLLQYDCGKLQKLATLLQDLVPNGHRALIFTQMTKVLDILEQFLNIHGYRYMRLDGATKIEDRQLLTEKFNRDPKIPVFILSTRSGGLGINLTGADTVIFYDSDWNPAMDKQCQDRCHRIGQMRDVHIYRFVSEYTIESNILKKANQKRQLDNVVIQEGDFTTDYLGKFSVRDLVNDTSIISDLPDKPIGEDVNVDLLAQAEDEADRNAAKEAMKEVAVDEDDFNEESKQGTPGPQRKPGEDIDDIDYDEGVGHIDEYMLRFIKEGYYVE